MKRDLNLVREILLRLEPLSATTDHVEPLNIGQPPLDIPGYTDEEIAYHIRIMADGGLIQYERGRPGIVQGGDLRSRSRRLHPLP